MRKLWAMAVTVLENVNSSSTCQQIVVSSVCFVINPKSFNPAHACLIES
jgi:hypothetical protein